MASSLFFTVKRQEPVLVPPAMPTPHDIKCLSDIDDQEGLRFHVECIHFYRHHPSMSGRDPAKVIKEALAKALVFYYPLAGRLREGPAGKLLVECTGEGVLFIEADADVRLDQFGDRPQPPFPCTDELIYDVEGSRGIVDCPLLMIQVTRLKCGGFVFGLRLNHTMMDGPGLSQFLTAMTEMARGDDSPSVLPVWSREILCSRNPPRVTHDHSENDPDPAADSTAPNPPTHHDMVLRSFFFGPKEISTLKSRLSPHLRSSSRFLIVLACIWHCRTLALFSNPDDHEYRLILVANGRGKLHPPLPKGYYGNVVASLYAHSPASKLQSNPLEYALELVKEATVKVTKDMNIGHMQSVANLIVLVRGKWHFTVGRTTFVVTDVTNAGFDRVDFGWGKPLFAGPANGDVGTAEWTSYFSRSVNEKGEDGILVPVALPRPAMEKFAQEIECMLTEPNEGKETKKAPLSRL